MKRLTKYKDGKFLLNHSSMNEALEKLGILEDIEWEQGMTFQEIVDIEKELMSCKWLYMHEYYDKTVRQVDLTDYTICTVLNDYDFVLLKYRDDNNSELEEVIYLGFFGYKHTWSFDKEDL